jgi:integrase
VQALLGHTSIGVTETYARLGDDAVRAELTRVAGF